jgi:hypothetical protein
MLSKILGCTRPTANKKLQELEQDRIIEASYGCIHIRNLGGMMKLSGQSEYF